MVVMLGTGTALVAAFFAAVFLVAVFFTATFLTAVFFTATGAADFLATVFLTAGLAGVTEDFLAIFLVRWTCS